MTASRPSPYHDGNRHWQDRFDTRRLADRLDEVFVSRPWLDDGARRFIESCDMFFLATADAEGQPQCSYKGGDPGFVRVLDETTLAFPDYDGNGMFLSLGNTRVNPQVGMLFIDFAAGNRLRVNGQASIDEADPLTASWAGARLTVRVAVTQVFPNCPRYIHKMELVEHSEFVPKAECETPDPDWKRYFEDDLPEAQRARRAARAAE